MSLWIRSQNREVLMKVETVGVNHDNKKEVVGYGVDSNVNLILGKYESEERTLEVLDIIQKHLNNVNYFGEMVYVVFEMPEE